MTTGTPVRVLPMGDGAVLAEVADIDAVLALTAALREGVEHAAEGNVLVLVEDLLPAARTVLVTLRPGTDPDRLTALSTLIQERAATVDPAAAATSDRTTVTIDVRYDGPDLAEVAELTGLSEHEVVQAHTDTPWRVGFAGFAPGFAYLVGGDERLTVPRRSEPRTAVPTGSVGLAGEFSGVYPRESPGGWQLIGRTDAVLWDPDATPPALLQPGVDVRFRAVEAGETPDTEGTGDTSTAVDERWHDTEAVDQAEAGSRLEVVATGPQVLVQDDGRTGLASVGVGRAGAADRTSYQLGNRVLGNRRRAASLEVLFGGLHVRAHGSVTVCLTGAPAPATVVEPGPDGARTQIGRGVPVHLRDGTDLVLGTPGVGMRTYLAVRGGIDVEPVLGSRSSDVMSGLGPALVEAGDVLPVGVGRGRIRGVDQAVAPDPPPARVTLRVTPGPRHSWFASPESLAQTVWTTSERSNRVGIRLDGQALARSAEHESAELPSEGMVRGAIQVPPNGQPVLFLNDHPLTGGYPVIGVVLSPDVDLAAQLQPGQEVVFRWHR